MKSIIKKRFSKHHTGLEFKDVAHVYEVGSYAESRGLEHLLWARAKNAGKAFVQNNPISSRRSRATVTKYIHEAAESFDKATSGKLDNLVDQIWN